MNNVLGDALKKALDAKTTSNFIWKGKKQKEDGKMVQSSEVMEEMSDERLIECYQHCHRMLYNENPKNLGRYNVLGEIIEQINKCNIELFLRYCENTFMENSREAIPRRNIYYGLRIFIDNTNKALKEEGKEEIEDWSKVAISNAASNLPDDFKNIPISEVLDGCIGYLGSFEKKHLTLTFITKMGLWFTKAEENDLKASSNLERLKIVKERLHLPEKLVLKLSDKGLSYKEMRAMLVLPPKQKYSDMTTDQLVALRDKILPRLQKHIDGHIYNWKKLQRQLNVIAKERGINLNDYIE